MDLKFSFGGASPDHDHGSDHGHGDAPPGFSLPITSIAPMPSGSSVLEVRATLAASSVIGEALSGDGVSYARAEVPVDEGADPPALARAARSALSRAVAGLEGPLSESVSAVVLEFGGAEAEVLGEFGLPAADAAVDDALQRRIGIAAGTPIRTA